MTNPQAYAESLRSMFDLSNFADIQRRNLEALTAANQIIMEGAQAISRRQAELAQANLQEVLQASRAMLSSGTPEAGMQKQAELAKFMFENGVENVREVTEMVTKSGFEAFDLMNQCAAESLTDLQKKPRKKK